MPPANPSYPRGPYRFLNREYLIITYETDPDAIRAMVPEPLEPDGSGQVHYEWIAMPDSSGFGSYHESGVVIPCTFRGEPVNYTAMMFLNDEPPISAGREIWGFPKRWGTPRLEVRADTLTGTLDYAGERVATGTMTYKYEDRMAPDPSKRGAHLRKTSVNLKIIPCVTGGTRIAELVAFNLTDISMHFHFSGPARLHLIPHINAPVPGMKKAGWGRIINIASAHGLVASPFKSAYVAAKHGLVGLTKTIALEVAEHGITVNAICPGYVWTPLVEKQIPDTAKARGMTEEQVVRDVLLAAQPTKKFATVEEMAALAVFLTTDGAASITGTALPVDGGWTAH